LSDITTYYLLRSGCRNTLYPPIAETLGPTHLLGAGKSSTPTARSHLSSSLAAANPGFVLICRPRDSRVRTETVMAGGQGCVDIHRIACVPCLMDSATIPRYRPTGSPSTEAHRSQMAFDTPLSIGMTPYPSLGKQRYLPASPTDPPPLEEMAPGSARCRPGRRESVPPDAVTLSVSKTREIPRLDDVDRCSS